MMGFTMPGLWEMLILLAMLLLGVGVLLILVYVARSVSKRQDQTENQQR